LPAIYQIKDWYPEYTENSKNEIVPNQWTNKKMSNWSKQNFLERRHSNGQKTHEKMLTISGYKGNANQNHTKIPPHPC
jgi:hypothetical protein